MNLFLIIKRKYFDQIILGQKTEELRIASPYFEKKLLGRNYKTITLQAGYNKNSPRLTAEYTGLELKEIQHEIFGPKPVLVFAIKLGKILNESSANTTSSFHC